MQDDGERRGGNGTQTPVPAQGAGPGPAEGPGPVAAPQDAAQAAGPAPAGTPAPMPLFYKSPEPLQVARFAGKGLRRPGDYRFAAQAHAVALHAQEFRFAAAHYPIVFSDDTAAMPLAVLGYRAGQNLFVDAEGRWAEGAYVPAYVRRYPFVTGPGAQPEERVLYLDSASDLVVDLASGSGSDPGVAPGGAPGGASGADPLFAEGTPGERVKQALEFCAAFQQQVPPTQAFVEAVEQNQLLETKEIRLDLPQGQQQLLTGLRILDEAKFNALPDQVYLDWRRQGWIALVYWHWASMDNFRRLIARG